MLANRNEADRKDALESLPEGLTPTYQTEMKRLKDKGKVDYKIAKRAMSWVYWAKRPLYMAELREAIAVNPIIDVENAPEDYRELDCKRLTDGDMIVQCCGSLIVWERSTDVVGFSHYTVTEFFKTNVDGNIEPEIYVTRTCLTYLAFDKFDSPCPNEESIVKRVQKYNLSRYAAQYWGPHTREAENEPDIRHAVLSLLASENKRDSMLQLETYANSSWGDISFTKGQTLLHVIAKNGLATICKRVLSRRINGNDTYVFEVDIQVN